MFRPFTISIIDKYILRLFLKNLCMSLCLFISIYLFSLLINDMPYFVNRMESGDKNITMPKIFAMYAHQIPYILLWVSPLSFLFSAIYTIGQLYKNNEAVAYVSAGVHIFRMNISIVITSFLYSLCLIPFTDYIVIKHSKRARELKEQMLRKKAETQTLEYDTYGENDLYFFMKQYNEKAQRMEYPIIIQEQVTEVTEYQVFRTHKTNTQQSPFPLQETKESQDALEPVPQSPPQKEPQTHSSPQSPKSHPHPQIKTPFPESKQDELPNFFKSIAEPKTHNPQSPTKHNSKTPEAQSPTRNKTTQEPPTQNPQQNTDPQKGIPLDFQDIQHLLQRPTDIQAKKQEFLLKNPEKHTQFAHTAKKTAKKPILLPQDTEYFPHTYQHIEEPNLFEQDPHNITKLIKTLQRIDHVKRHKITEADMQIDISAYSTRPFPSQFRFRIDARSAQWDQKKERWVLEKVQKRTWTSSGDIKIEHFEHYILHEVNESPKHFSIRNTKIEDISYTEGKALIKNLQRTHRKWKEKYIDLYTHKIAFQLSTFLVVFLGVNLMKLYSRKLTFMNSLFASILLFVTYFSVFQLLASFTKAAWIVPVAIAPWCSGLLFFVLGCYRVLRVAS